MKYDKEHLAELIWQNPAAVTPLSWRQHGAEQWANQYPDGSEGGRRQDRTTLKRNAEGHIFVHCNGTSAFQSGDIWQYLEWLNNTNDFNEVLQLVADTYGVEPDYSGYSEAQQQRYRQRRKEGELLKIAAKYITAAMTDATGMDAAKFAHSRGLNITERMGANSSAIREGLKAHLQKHGVAESEAEELLQRWFTKWNADDYKLAMPYTNGTGNVIGFAMRRTTDNIYYTDSDGQQAEKPKYLYTKGMARGCGYCENLQGGVDNNVYLVEGILDAESMKQAGFSNVIALGGMTPADNENEPNKAAIRTLQRYNAKKLYYIPDVEYYDAKDEAKGAGKAGQRKQDATHRTIKALLPYLTGTIDGEGFAAIRIVDIQSSEAKEQRRKEDADSVLHADGYGAPYMQNCIDNAAEWYEYALQEVVRNHADDTAIMTAKAQEVYRRIDNYAQRNTLKGNLTESKSGYLQTLKEAGLTAQALSLIDRDGIGATWRAQMAEVVADMRDAKTPETMGALLNKAQRIQAADSFNTFAAQINVTKEELHRAVAAKPEYLETTWQLWKERDKQPYPNRVIGFAPAAVSIVAAPTNHGKTLFLLQTAINAALSQQKQIIYISLENDAEQLYIRALAAYMGNVLPADMANPRAEIREYIKNADMPKTLYKEDKTPLDIGSYINMYWRHLGRNLRLLRGSSDIDTIVNNVAEQVLLWQNNGIETAAVFVDYLQLLHAPNIRAHSRTDEVKYICDRLNDMAKQTKLPVVLAAQLNRDATRNNGDKLDGVELANIGESAGIENIAEDVYLIWQVDKINIDADSRITEKDNLLNVPKNMYRTRRCFRDYQNKDTLRRGYLYIENLKARDYATGGYCLLPFNGAAGAITSKTSEQ